MSAITDRRARRWVVPLVGMTAAALMFSMSELPTTSRAKADPAPVEASAAHVTERPTADAAFTAARAQNARVEILAERTEASTTWARPDGQRETEFSAPFRMQRGGRWYTLDPTLTATRGNVSLPVVSYGEKLAARGSADKRSGAKSAKARKHVSAGAAGSKDCKHTATSVGKVDRGRWFATGSLAPRQKAKASLRADMRAEMKARQKGGSRYGNQPVLAPRVSSIPVRVSAGAAGSGEQPLGEIATNQGASIAAYWPADLPAPKVSGPQATYVLSENEDLTVTATHRGFDAHIVLEEAPQTAPVYRFPIDLDGVRLVRTPDGGYSALNGEGRAVFRIAPLVMWDSSTAANPDDPDAGPITTSVASSLATDEQGRTVLELRPSLDYLQAAQCPCTIDPNFTYTGSPLKDTMIRQATPSTSFGTAINVQSGYKDATTGSQRALIAFYTPLLIGRKINSATLQLRNNDVNSCTATQMDIHPATAYWDEATTWNTRPNYSLSTTYKVSSTFAHGIDGTGSLCPNAYKTFNVTNMVSAWIAGTLSDYGFMLRAANETDPNGYKQFCSFDLATTGTSCNQAAWSPKLTVIYNTVPALATNTSMSPAADCTAGTGSPPWVDTKTPILRASANDLDEEPTKLQYEILPLAGGAAVASGLSPQFLPPGAINEWMVPATAALLDGGSYKWHARGYDGADYSAQWSDYGYHWCEFRIDTTAPTAPAIASTDYPAGQWSNGAGTVGTFTITPGSDPAGVGGAGSGVQGISWSLDDPTPSTAVDLNAGGGIDPITVTPDTDGEHTLYVATVDKARNISTVTAHQFFVGSGALTSPAPGDRTARRLSLAARVKDATAVTFQYRRGETAPWTDVPGGTSVPVAAGITVPFVWDAASTLGGDGAVQLRVLLAGGSAAGTGSAPISVTIDRLASDAATTKVGPGTLNLLTGDYTLESTDASYFGVSISRTARSRDPESGDHVGGIVAPFGPQWSAGGVSEIALSDYTALTRTSPTSVELTRTDATAVQFTLTDDPTTGAPYWAPEEGSKDLTLQGEDATGYTLTGTDGTVTTFTRAGGTGPFTVASATPPGAGNSTRYHYGSDGAGKLRLDRLVAPNASLDVGTCNVAGAPAAGCRKLDLTYAASTTATSTTLGDYVGRVSGVSLWVTNPTTGTVSATQVARYAYDDQGRLREAWDPRISPALKTAYTYDSAGRVLTMAPPGELGHTFTYGQAGDPADTNTGRLLTVSRAALDGGKASADWNVVYDVPLTTVGGPYQMDATEVAKWGQTVAPVDATAVFPPDQIPPGHTGAQGPWTRATIPYLDVEGRQLNTAVPGGGITATDYDKAGNPIRQLTENNRARALRDATDPELIALGLADLPTAQRADQLSTTSLYNSTGQRLLQEFGPVHPIVLPGSGGLALARRHTVNTYDQNRPTDGTATVADQITETEVGARVVGADTDTDVRETRVYYDWAKGKPNKVIRDVGGLNITTVTDYDAQARPTRTDMPSAFAAGRTNGADTTFTTYYSADAAAPCNSAVMDGMVCRTSPAGAITGGGTNPTQRMTTTTTYTDLGQTATVTETANGTTRTTTTGYDGAGRATSVTTTGGLGTAVPTVATTYSSTTGRVLTTKDTSVTPNPTITRTYDTLGRVTSYTDADGGRTDTTYTYLDQVASTRQYQSGTALLGAATTYSYSSDRQLPVSMVDPIAGTFTATYDLAGQITGQGLPGGVTSTQADDPTGAWLTRTYAKSTGETLLTETVRENIHGQWVTRVRGDATKQGSDQTFTYDQIGRLSTALDTDRTGCTRRDYGFDVNTNRTSFAQAAATTCPTTAGTPTATGYDTADRLIATGYTYDNHGRTTAAPLAAGSASLAYFVNDRIQRKTTGTNRQTWTLDPALRFRAWTTETQSGGTWTQNAAKTNHYNGDDDSPEWITDNTTGGFTRNVASLTGDMAAGTGTTAGTYWLTLTTLHGDVGQALHFTGGAQDNTLVYDTDEYGNKKSFSTTPAFGRYLWLGGKQRSTETVGQDLILMGVRLYNPTTGRFLSVDPIPGGSANAYEYCFADPVNCFDLDGRFSLGGLLGSHVFRSIATSIGIGAVCAFSAGIGCALAAGAIIGGGLSAASYYYNSSRHSSYGYIRSFGLGAIIGAGHGLFGWAQARHLNYLGIYRQVYGRHSSQYLAGYYARAYGSYVGNLTYFYRMMLHRTWWR